MYHFQANSILMRCGVALMVSSALAGQVWADGATGAPLESHPDGGVNFTTGNVLSKGAVRLHVGSHQTEPGHSTTGTGNQIYYGGIEWGATDRLQLGAGIQYFQDPPGAPILGTSPDSKFYTISAQAKYQFIENDRWAISALGSLELLGFESALFGTDPGPDDQHLIGALQLPITYKASDQLQFHLTPGVSIFPDDINGIEYFGSVTYVGVGATWKPNERWLAYGHVNTPLSGGNAISSTRSIEREPVWTVGTQFNVSPKTALNVFATNGFGTTPATSILPFFPDGDITMVGATVTYTPGNGPNYRSNYRGIQSEPQTPRNASLQLDGFTLSSADTISPRAVQLSAFYGDDDNAGGALIIAPDYDFQAELIVEQPSDDGSVVAGDLVPNFDTRYWIGAKLRLLDQNNGSPVSVSVHPMLGRDTSDGLTGVLYLDVPVSYKANDQLVWSAVPKFAAWGDTRLYGLGLGVNYGFAKGFEVIGEVTPVSEDQDTVWAAGVRYHIPGAPVHLDVHATNAISRYGLGTLVSQDDVKVAFGATLLLGQ